MPAPATTATTDDAPAWYVPLARAIPALALALVITFNADHSAALGLVTLGLFGIVAGAILTAFAFRSAKGVARTITLAQGLVTIAAGIASLAAPGGGLPYFVFVLTAFAAITGFLELYLGLRSRGRSRASRDWVFAGALTAVLALVVLLLPPDFSQQFTGPDGVTRELTASVIVVGALGAYWAILGVYLVIAGLSLKWQAAPVAANGA
ncbi:MAG: hypothetical protein JWP85_376 [Rhodoglobus sp.]|nr:hypothetical protein [Rhodoglobus sp.]